MNENKMAYGRSGPCEYCSRELRTYTLSTDGKHIVRTNRCVCGSAGCAGCPRPSRAEILHDWYQRIIIAVSCSAVGLVVAGVILGFIQAK